MKNPDRLQAVSGFEQLSLLPEPKFTPRWPVPHTLQHRCLDYLLTGRHLTPPIFQDMTGSWRLAASVHELKDLGWPIQSSFVPAPPSASRNRYMARYWLPSKVLRVVSRRVQ